MLVKIANVAIDCVQGDIAAQDDFNAVVNAANAELRTGGGVAGALHRAAGPGLAEEGSKFAPIEPGHAVITGGHDLPNAWVIHCLGPVYGVDEPSDLLLTACYENALRLAEQHGIVSVAFPAISTGAFGYPVEEAAKVAFETVADEAPTLQTIRRIRFVLHDRNALKVHEKALADVLESRKQT